MMEAIRAPQIGDAEILALVSQITDYAIFLITREGDVASWNPGAERIKGYKAGEIVGKNFRIFYPPEDQTAQKPEHELEEASRAGRFEDEGWRVRNDGSQFWASVIITAIRGADGKLLGYGKVTRDLTERKISEGQIRELSRRILTAQDEERRRLGRELHDTVGQHLLAAKMSLESLHAGQPMEQAELQKRVAGTTSVIDRCVREVRTLSYLLYPPMLDEIGLASAIPWFLDGFSERSEVKATFESDGNVERLPREVELALFRIVQESLTNVHRHARSKTAQVKFTVRDNEARIEISDQGQGIRSDVLMYDPVSTRKAGVGIRSMRERAEQLGGKLDIRSGQHGTTVEAVIPIHKHQTNSRSD